MANYITIPNGRLLFSVGGIHCDHCGEWIPSGWQHRCRALPPTDAERFADLETRVRDLEAQIATLLRERGEL